MKAIKGRRSYTFYDPKQLYVEVREDVFGESIVYDTLGDYFTNEEIDDMEYGFVIEAVASLSKPSDFINELLRQGYTLETNSIEYTGDESIDETDIYNYTLSEWLEEIKDKDEVSVSYKGKLIDLLYMLTEIPTTLKNQSDFINDIDNREDMLDKEYELVFSFSDSGIEWELV